MNYCNITGEVRQIVGISGTVEPKQTITGDLNVTGFGGGSYEIGDGLKVEGNRLSVDTATAVEQDNTKPVTSAAVYTVVGNIETLLGTI